MSEVIETPPPSEEGSAPPRRRSRWRRLLVICGWSAAGLLALLLLAIALLLFSDRVAAALVERGVLAYSERIPGSVELGEVRGDLWSGLVIEDLAFADREARPLAEVGVAELAVELSPLLRGRVSAEALRLDRVRVHLPPESSPGFADLAPPGEDTPPEATPPGPDLPIDLALGLELGQVELYGAPDAEAGAGTQGAGTQGAGPAEPLLRLSHARVSAGGGGRDLHARLELGGALPQLGLEVEELVLALAWAKTELSVSEFRVRSNWGAIDLASSKVQFRPEASTSMQLASASLPGLELRAEPEPISSRGGPQLEGPATLELELGAEAERGQGRLELDAPGLARGAVDFGGSWGAQPRAELDASFELRPRALVEGAAEGTLHLRSEVDFVEAEDGGLELRARLSCEDCDPAGGPTQLVATLGYAPDSGAAVAELEAQSAGLALQGQGKLGSEGAFEADLKLEFASLARVRELAARFGAMPELRGHGELELHCRGELAEDGPAALECENTARLDEGAPLERLRLAARTQLDAEGIALELSTLEARGRGVGLRLTAPEMRVRYAPETRAVELEGLALQLSPAREGGRPGRITAGGRWTAAPSGEMDLEASLKDIDLRWIDRLGLAGKKSLGLAGMVDAQLRAEGAPAEPTLSLRTRAKGLRYAGRSVGELSARAGASGSEVELHADLRGPLVPVMALDAWVPIRVRLDGQAPEFREREEARVQLRAEQLHLARVVALAGSEVELAGRAEIRVDGRGALGAPRVQVDAGVREASFEGQSLGALDLEARLARGALEAGLSWAHPAWRRLELKASSRVHADLVAGHFALRPSRQDQAKLELEGLSLSRMREAFAKTLASLPELGGELGLEAELTDPWSTPELALTLDGRGLSLDERPLGRLHADARYEDRGLELLAAVNEAKLGDLGVKARVPVQVSLRRGEFDWKRDAPHELDLAVAGTQLAVLDAFLPEPPHLEGRAEAELALRGRLAAPRVDLRARIDDMSYGGRWVGDVDLRSSYGKGGGGQATDAPASAKASTTARAEVDLVHDPSRTVHAKALLPLRVDLLAGEVEWLRARRHELELEAPKIDEVLLAPVLETPEGTRFELGAQLHAEGTVERFTAQLAAEGTATHEGRRVPLALALDADAAHQSLELLVGDTLEPWVSLNAEARASVSALLDDPESWPRVSMAAQVESRAFPLRRLEALMPPELQGIEGSLDLHAAIQGELARPSLSGTLDLNDGALTVVPLRQRFESIEVGLALDRDRMRLSKLEAWAGRGGLEGKGEARIDAERGLVAELDLVARNLPIRRPGMPRMKLNAEFLAEAEVNGEGAALEIGIADARLDVQKGNASAPKSIEEFEGVYYVDLLPEASGAWVAGAPAGMNEPKTRPSQPSDLRVVLRDPLRVTGPGIDMSWDGEVSARASEEKVLAKGALECTSGHFSLLGNDFTISQAAVRLPEQGGLMPFIDLKADTDVDGVQITASIRGPVSRPTLSLSSQPSYSESDIFTMLVTGSSDLDSADPEEVKARAASTLVALSSPALQAQLNQALRVDKVGLTFGDTTDQPILSVGKQISKRLYAESQYHFNAPPTKNSGQVSLRYRFAPRWSLETFIGDAAVGGVDIFWSLAFDGKLSKALRERREEKRRREAEELKSEPEPESAPASAPEPAAN